MIKFYGKDKCPSCDFFYMLASKKFKENKLELIKFDSDGEMIETMLRYNVKSIPFITINDNTVIPTSDLESLIRNIKN